MDDMLLLANSNYLKELRTGNKKCLINRGWSKDKGCFVPTWACPMTSELAISNSEEKSVPYCFQTHPKYNTYL